MTAGSVGDGKSTLIGRLLHDAGVIYEDHLQALRKKAGREGDPLDFSLLTDGLKAEREQGITIDVAYRYFETSKRRFIVADTPGHEQYTRNMATGASTADLAIILVDARLGVLTQSKRHGFIASLLGVPRAVLAVNKMDLVGYNQEVFEKIRGEYATFAQRLGFAELRCIPVSAVHGDNVVTAGTRMPWFEGPALLPYLEEVYIASDANLVDFRFPIQRVVRPDGTFRGYSGTVASGVARPGEEVVALPSGQRTHIERIVTFTGDLPYCHATQSVTLTLADEVDAGRGDMLAHPRNVPRAVRSVEAMVVWMGNEPLAPGRTYIVKHTSRSVKASCATIAYRVDPNTLRQGHADELRLNDIGRVAFTMFNPLFVDEYRQNRTTGSFIVIDPASNETVGAGMIIARRAAHVRAGVAPASKDIAREVGHVTWQQREALLGQSPLTVWFTGLSGSGKSTLAKAIERRLVELGRPCFVLDGDNLRHGLNRDLDFSPEDRTENIRRAAEVARLMNDAGLIVISAFISPYRQDREDARGIVGAERFIEVHLSTDLATCEQRDPKGLYRKARSGALAQFTGISAPYERPQSADVSLDTAAVSIEAAVETLVERIMRGIISSRPR